MTASHTLEAIQITEEADLLLRASEVLDSMWYGRYHGGTSSGTQGNARWVALRSVANDIAKWRKRNGFKPTETRAAETRLERLASGGLRRAASPLPGDEGRGRG